MTDVIDPVEALRELDAKRSRGKWRVLRDGPDARVEVADGKGWTAVTDSMPRRDADFMVAVANALPALLALAEKGAALTAAEATGMVWVKREVLEPFAKEAAVWGDYIRDSDGLFIASPDDIEPILDEYASLSGCVSTDVSYSKETVTVGDLRAIASLLSARPSLTGPEQATEERK